MDGSTDPKGPGARVCLKPSSGMRFVKYRASNTKKGKHVVSVASHFQDPSVFRSVVVSYAFD